MRIPKLVAYEIGVGLMILIGGMFAAPRQSEAMPTFAQATGLQCSACHTIVPLLNAYGRYVQRTGYSALDHDQMKRVLPVWIGESVNFDASATPDTGVNRYSFGNLALHGAGYLAPDVTFHYQQWIVQGDQPGGIDTLWVAYSNLFHRDGHLFVGKLENPAPSPYSQDFEIDGPSASSTVVGEHDWAATYNNRWGTKLNYTHGRYSVEAAYLLSGDDLNGVTDFNAGDKTFEWKANYAFSKDPIEAGLFGSVGTIPVSTGTNQYSSTAAYVQVDPGSYGRPGVLAVYQMQRDSNPGVDSNTGNIMPSTNSRGTSVMLYEPFVNGNIVLGLRHDFNDNGFGTLSNGNAVNVAFNLPYTKYLHGYLEANTGGNSTFAGASGGPTWKGMLWLTIPVKPVK